MKQVIIADTPRFTVTSFGNGLSYLIFRKADGAEVFLQGEDAALWREDWCAREDKNPFAVTDDHLCFITEPYF